MLLDTCKKSFFMVFKGLLDNKVSSLVQKNSDKYAERTLNSKILVVIEFNLYIFNVRKNMHFI
jgi:hypothetical protein